MIVNIVDDNSFDEGLYFSINENEKVLNFYPKFYNIMLFVIVHQSMDQHRNLTVSAKHILLLHTCIWFGIVNNL